MFGLVALILIIMGSGFAFYKATYGGTTYYVQIHEDGKEKKVALANGDFINRYDYNMKGFDSRGSGKILKFDADHNLRHEAYLKMTYNKTKGVTSWEEVQKSKLPEKALKALE